MIKKNTIHVRFWPVLRVGAEQAETYRCQPVLETAAGKKVSGPAMLEHRGDAQDTAERNAEVVRRSFSNLVKASHLGPPPRLIVPVDCSCLALKEGATAIVTEIKKLAEPLRRAVVMEVVNLPALLSLNILEDATIPLLPFCDFLIARPNPGMEDYVMFANCNYQGVSIDLKNRNLPSKVVHKRLKTFWAAARRARLQMFIEGIASKEAVETAERYEAEGMDGKLVGKGVKELPALEETVRATA